MQLRPRQTEFVRRAKAALDEYGDTLGIAPTGAGKTVMLSAIAGQLPGPGLVLHPRIELVGQNHATFRRVNRTIRTAEFTADAKKWAPGEGWTFGMVQSVANVLDELPNLGSLVIDEAHHSTAPTYMQIIAAARAKNPKLKLFGTTATPGRGDKRTLKAVYSNVADAITVSELIATGHLVKPRTFVVDIGVGDELRKVKQLASDFDMEEVAEILDHTVLNDRVVEEWKKVAGNRRTVVFAANVKHSQHVRDAFVAAGVRAAHIDGAMPGGERERILSAFDKGEIDVLCNVAVLTEGWDCQPCSCCILLRPSSFRSTMVQMIGRVLRPVDPERYPGIIKPDSIVLDFGTSILQHGSIETEKGFGSGDTKSCRACDAVIPGVCPECPLCGAEQRAPGEDTDEAEDEDDTKGPASKAEKAALADFVLTEVDLLRTSPYRWEDLFQGRAMIATAFDAWAAMVNVRGAWFSVGGKRGAEARLLAAGQERLVALAAADDYLREHGDDDAAAKNKRWLTLPATEKQLQALNLSAMQGIGVTRYRAACLMTWKWSESIIRNRVEGSVRAAQAAA